MSTTTSECVRGAAHHLGVIDHFVERHGQRVAVPLDDHRHGVADQQPLDQRIEQPGHRKVVGREHGDLFAGRLHGPELRNRDLTGLFGHGDCKPTGFRSGRVERRPNSREMSLVGAIMDPGGDGVQRQGGRADRQPLHPLLRYSTLRVKRAATRQRATSPWCLTCPGAWRRLFATRSSWNRKSKRERGHAQVNAYAIDRGVAGAGGCAGGGGGPSAVSGAPNSLALDESGKLEGLQGNFIKFRDSKQEVWLLQVNAQTAVNIAGEADLSYLRPGMVVELSAAINEDSAIDEPIAEIEVLDRKGRPSMGLFAVDDAGESAKPVRDPSAGEYRVRGRITSVKEGNLEIAAGRLKITGKAADDMKVVLAVDDPRLAQFGDEIKVKAWYYDAGRPNPTLNRQGQALAESVDITLANPPVSGKRGR